MRNSLAWATFSDIHMRVFREENTTQGATPYTCDRHRDYLDKEGQVEGTTKCMKTQSRHIMWPVFDFS